MAATPSGFSGVVAGESGIWLGTRLQSFNAWEGHPNCIEPGKRPRITLTPTIVLKGGKPVYAVSVAGGDGQDQATLQLLVNSIDFGLAPAKAATATRFGTDHFLGSFRQKAPVLGSLYLPETVDDDIVKDLAARGHKITRKRFSVAPVMIRLNPDGSLEAAGDPKARRHAGAY